MEEEGCRLMIGTIFTIKHDRNYTQCKVERVEGGVVYFKTLTSDVQIEGALNIETLEKLIEEEPHAPNTSNAS